MSESEAQTQRRLGEIKTLAEAVLVGWGKWLDRDVVLALRRIEELADLGAVPFGFADGGIVHSADVPQAWLV